MKIEDKTSNSSLKINSDGSIDTNLISKDSRQDIISAINSLAANVAFSPDMDMATFRKRMTAIIESGTITTVTTVTTLANISSVGGYQSQSMVMDANHAAWGLCCRERIS